MTTAKPSTQTQVLRVRRGQTTQAPDVVATEEPMEIRLYLPDTAEKDYFSVSVTMRTPGDDFELAAGFLFTEGVLPDADAIQRISYCTDVGEEQRFNLVNVYLKPWVSFDRQRLLRHFYTTSSCGVCGKASLEALELKGCPILPRGTPIVAADVLYQLPDALRKAQRVFEKTGGLHAAGLFDATGHLKVLREDVGRHNAVDKTIGHQLLAGKVPLGDTVLVVSGRASFEILQKALAASIPMVVAVGAPSSLAVDMARQFHMTLIGFARSDGFNVYAGDERVLR